MPNRLRQVVETLRKEESSLESQLGTIRNAIAALGGTFSRKQTQRAKPSARKRREMTAAQKAKVSKRMKKYWAERRKASK